MHLQLKEKNEVGESHEAIRALNSIHAPCEFNEYQRIIKAGFHVKRQPGRTDRVFNPRNRAAGINMSRTIGDFMFKHSLTDRNCSSFDYALSNEADVKEFQFCKAN